MIMIIMIIIIIINLILSSLIIHLNLGTQTKIWKNLNTSAILENEEELLLDCLKMTSLIFFIQNITKQEHTRSSSII